MKITSAQALSQHLKVLRKQRGISQAKVAELVGLRQGTVSNFETAPDKMQLDTLFRILSALELELTVQPRNSRPPASDWPEEW